MVRSRSAKPLFAGSIPAPASYFARFRWTTRLSSYALGSIDSLASRELTLSGFVYVARLPPAPFPPPPLFIGKMARKEDQKMGGENRSENKSAVSVTSADVSSRSFEIAGMADALDLKTVVPP